VRHLIPLISIAISTAACAEVKGSTLFTWRRTQVDAEIPLIIIQARSNLVSGSWVSVGTHAPANGVNTWSAGSSVQGFYRLAVTNAP
jgi:hypothetical protein